MASIEQRIHDGARAKEVIDSEAFQSAFEKIEQEIIEKWKEAPLRDVEGRERLHQYLTALHKVKQVLVTTMETGMLAEKDLKHNQSLLSRAKDWLSTDSEPI